MKFIEWIKERVTMKKIQRTVSLFFDMDGTLTEYRTNATLEDYKNPEFFLGLKPKEQMIRFVKQNADRAYIASKVHTPEIIQAKDQWLDRYLPEIPKERRIYIPYTESKASAVAVYLKEPLSTRHLLYDDNSDVLVHDWTANGGFGVKVDNGINCRGKKWQGMIVNAKNPEKLVRRSDYGK